MLDVIGDVHGHLAALQNLLEALGYRDGASGELSHPDGRHLLFVGDLIDYGPQPAEVCELVMQLTARGQATCLMGNHEYNFLEACFDIQAPRKSGEEVFLMARADPSRWAAITNWMADLPLAIQLPRLRVVHAIWHARCFELLESLRCTGPLGALPTQFYWPSPFVDGALRQDLPTELIPHSMDVPHAVILKGAEHMADQPFLDTRGVQRDRLRSCWWRDPNEGAGDVVFGHYRGLPPFGEQPLFAPPHPQGTPASREWLELARGQYAREGQIAIPEDVRAICVDYEAVSAFHADEGRVTLGAYRYPERRLLWASAPSGRPFG